MMKPRLVLCSGAEVPQNHLSQDRKVIELDTLDPGSNTHLRLENVTDAFAQHLPDRLVDLLEIAAYVYTADCEASRELAWMDDKSTEPWSRDFNFVMPVRDLAFWNREDVQQRLVSALNFLSSDQFDFTFCELKKGREVRDYLQMEVMEDKPFFGVDRVIMFSGGLDSLAGAAESAHRGEQLVLVSHRPAVQTNKRQKELAKCLGEKFNVPIRHIPVWVNKSGFDRESTQRTRSFLFSTLGAAVAFVLKAGGVRFYENGVISLNWPLADESQQSRASRTTHPEALQKLQEFYRLVTENDNFVIDNPYIFKTKTEVVSIIAENGASDLVQHSCSCAHTMFQPKNQWHCGRCGQCIDRRIAILASGLNKFDSNDDYVSDVFTGPRVLNQERPYNHNIAVNYARFASDLNRMTEQEIATQYSLELIRAVRCFPNVGEAAQQFIEMHKRHAASVYTVLDGQIKLHSQEFVDGSLERSSMLSMIGRGEHIESQPNTSDPPETILKDGNMFQLVGDFWDVRYEGKAIHLKDTDGARYLHLLLQPHDSDGLLVREMYTIVHRKSSELPINPHSGMSLEELADDDLFINSDDHPTDKQDDAELIATYRASRDKWLADLEQAKRSNNPGEAAELQQKLDNLIGFMKREFGLDGRPRPKGDPNKQAYDRVSKSILRVLQSIKKDNLLLYVHLANCLHYETYTYQYTPEKPINWAI